MAKQLVAVCSFLLAFVGVASAQVQVEYYHVDAIGSVRAVTDQAGQVVRTHVYGAFGEGDPTTFNQSAVRFAGKERDPQLGLDYFGARYYTPIWGRFTTVDPVLDQNAAVQNPQRWNRYAYAANNPLRNVDPDGRDFWDLGIGMVQGLWNTAKGVVLTPYYLVTDPVGVASAVADDVRLLGNGIRHPGDVLDAYVSLARSPNDADQRALGASIGLGMGTAALALAPAKGAGVRQPAQVQLNRAAGNAFRDELAGMLRQAGRDVELEVPKKTPFGPRVIDIEVSQNGKVLGGIEAKTGGSRYKPAQRAKDTYLRYAEGYIVNVARKP